MAAAGRVITVSVTARANCGLSQERLDQKKCVGDDFMCRMPYEKADGSIAVCGKPYSSHHSEKGGDSKGAGAAAAGAGGGDAKAAAGAGGGIDTEEFNQLKALELKNAADIQKLKRQAHAQVLPSSATTHAHVYHHHEKNALSLDGLNAELKLKPDIVAPAKTATDAAPSKGAELDVFQRHLHTALGMPAPRQKSGSAPPPSVVFGDMCVTDTHARAYLDGYKPDLSIHPASLVPGPFSVMAVVEVQAADKALESPDAEHCGRVMSYNTTILDSQPQRSYVLSAVTTVQVTRFVRSERAGSAGGSGNNSGSKSIRHSISAGVTWSKAWPLLAAMAQGRLAVGFEPVYARSGGGVDLMAISVLGSGASGAVYGMCDKTRVANADGEQHEPSHALKVTRATDDAKSECDFIQSLCNSLREGEGEEQEVLRHLPAAEMAGPHLLLTPCAARLESGALRADDVRAALRVLSALHTRRLVWCDLKPEHFRIADDGGAQERLVLIDFGFAVRVDEPVRGTSRHYSAQAVLSRLDSSEGVKARCEHDLESFVKCVVALLYGPFHLRLLDASSSSEISAVWDDFFGPTHSGAGGGDGVGSGDRQFWADILRNARSGNAQYLATHLPGRGLPVPRAGSRVGSRPSAGAVGAGRVPTGADEKSTAPTAAPPRESGDTKIHIVRAAAAATGAAGAAAPAAAAGSAAGAAAGTSDDNARPLHASSSDGARIVFIASARSGVYHTNSQCTALRSAPIEVRKSTLHGDKEWCGKCRTRAKAPTSPAKRKLLTVVAQE